LDWTWQKSPHPGWIGPGKKALTQGDIAIIKWNLHQGFFKTALNDAQFIAVSLLQSRRNTVV
jgi:hypothetical protein